MTKGRTVPRALALVVLAMLVLAACGQKEGVHVSGRADGGGFEGGDGFDTGDGFDGGDGFEGGDGLDTGDGTGGDSGGGTAGGGGGGTAGGGGGGTAGGGGGGTAGGGTAGGGGGGGGTAGGGGGGQAAPSGPAWGDTIVIGIHAPITGAAPVPSTVGDAVEVYPRWKNQQGGIHGRTLAVRLVNDEYQPATAVQSCQELVQRHNAFVLFGVAGTDQIQACARFAESAGVPYVSAGVTERGLRELQGYFALSMSYRQQGPYLANFIKRNFPDRAGNVAMVYSDTPNFADAVQGFTGAIDARTYKLSRVPSSTELANTARQMCIDGVQVAYPLMAPTDWLTMLRAVTCDIQWSGVGITMGINSVASVGCADSAAQFEGSTFFSPFPGVDTIAQIDPEFGQAVQGQNWDDIYVLAWTAEKAIGTLLERAGENLTRAGFVRSTEQAQNVRAGANPTLSYTPDDHFGASEVHVLRADCSRRQYVTMETFARY